MGEAAARAGDGIHHSSALTGFIVGSLIGAALIGYVAFSTFTCGFGAALLAGLLAGFGANAIRALSQMVGSLFTNNTGTLLPPSGSANVFINGLPAARAVLSQGACKKDMPMSPIAQGSSNVFINGQPAARQGDKLTCGATISEGSTNVFIGGGTVSCLDINDEIPQWAKTASELLFTAAGIVGGAAGAFKNVGKVFNKCAFKFVGGYVLGEVASNYISDQISGLIGGLFGNPVDVTNGQKYLFDEQELDFSLPGRLPITWQRFYSSELTEAGALGVGWRLEMESSLRKENNQIIYCGKTGQQTAFPLLAMGEYSYCSGSQLFIYCLADGRHAIRTLDDIFYLFTPFDENDQAWLSQIEDSDNHVIRYHYDIDYPGRVIGISDQHHQLTCQWHASLARLASIKLITGGTPRELVGYHYDELGQLIAVDNQHGRHARQFNYQQGLMTEHRNPLGFRCDYQWGLQGETQRVIFSSTSENESARYQYDLANGVTRVTDERNLTAIWFYDEQQQVTQYHDVDNSGYLIDYNADAMPIGVTLPGQRRLSIERDSLNRIISETDPLGRITRTHYDANSLRIIRQEQPNGAIWQHSYDEQGHLFSSTHPLGQHTQYQYDDKGLLRQTTDTIGNINRFRWNELGQLSQQTDCSGNITQYQWDNDHHLATITDALGNISQFTHDLHGKLRSTLDPNGQPATFYYNQLGQLTEYTDVAGQTQQWRHSVRGDIAGYRDRLKRTINYYYNYRGELERIQNGNGGDYRFDRDITGRLIQERRVDSTRICYHYNECGQLAQKMVFGSQHQERTPQYRQTSYQYDAANRLLSQHDNLADTHFDYDDADQLIGINKIPNQEGLYAGVSPSQLYFRWDKNGQLQQEINQQQQHQLDYQYNELGQLNRLSLKHHDQEDQIGWLYYGSGHISAINYNQQLITEFERDELHRELSRSQGQLTQTRGYDNLGRRTQQQSIANISNHPMNPQFNPSRQFQYDSANNLSQTMDAF